MIELPPAGTLAGIARRELPGVETVAAASTPDDLAAARALVARHGSGSQGEHTPDWRVVVAPAGGHVRRAPASARAPAVRAGSRLGAVRTSARSSRSAPRTTACWWSGCCEDGDLVGPASRSARLVPGTAEEAR